MSMLSHPRLDRYERVLHQHEAEHPAFLKSFSAEKQHEMIEEDAEAGFRVYGLLALITAIGMLLGLMIVLVAIS